MGLGRGAQLSRSERKSAFDFALAECWLLGGHTHIPPICHCQGGAAYPPEPCRRAKDLVFGVAVGCCRLSSLIAYRRFHPISFTLFRMSCRLGFALALTLFTACQAQKGNLFQPPRHIPVGRGPVHVELADVNADGKLDVLVANSQDGTITVLQGDGHGGLKPAAGSPFAAGPEPNDIAVADFNHDGHPDLAIANHTVPQFTLLLGDGKSGFHQAPGSPFTILTKPHSHGIAAAAPTKS